MSLLSPSLWAQTPSEPTVFSSSQEMTFVDSNPTAGLDAENRVQIGVLHLDNLTPENIDQALEQIPDNKDILVSTDSEKVLQKVARWAAKGRKGLTRVLPLGPLIGKAKNHIVDRVKKDPGTAMIVTISTMFDSYFWLHVTEHSPEVRAAQMIFTAGLALSFGLDKDLWVRCSKKVQGKLLGFFDPALIDNAKASKYLKFATKVSSHLIMAAGIQTVRFGILAYDQTLDAKYLVASALGIGTIAVTSVFSSIGWLEFAASVNENSHPFAKFVARRVADVRSLTLGMVASSSKLMSPQVYGYSPWAVLVVSGTIGFTAFFNSPKIINWLEFSPKLEFVRLRYQQLGESFRSLISSAFPSGKSTGLACRRVHLPTPALAQ